MKRLAVVLLLATNVITLVALYYVYTHPVKSMDPEKSNALSCYDCSEGNLHGETAAEFSDVTARYRSSNLALYDAYIQGGMNGSSVQNPPHTAPNGFQDARSCWFPADTLKKFICLMEYYAAKINIPSSQLGVRFYYANYSDTISNTAFANHHTLYLTPTAYDDKNQANIDFEPKLSADNNSLVTLSELIYPEEIRKMEARSKDYKSSVAYKAYEQRYNTQRLFILSPGVPGTHATSSTMSLSSSLVSMNQGDLCPPGTGCNPTVGAIDYKFPSFHF